MPLIICNDRQRILDADGHVLVTGGPGSGKTTIALVKAGIRIQAGLKPGQCVLFLSFSKAAVARIVGEAKSQLPKELQSRLVTQTFHSFFWEVLRGHAYLLGAPKRLRLLLPYDEKALRDGAEGESAAWTSECERLFLEDGLITFDLFAPKALDLLTGCCRLRDLIASCFPLILVDEAQDTSEEQWQCVKALAERSQLICLADLEQQIFDFRRGVSSERLADIMASLKPLRVDLQAQNHRSPNCEIVTFGNDILLNTPRGGVYKGVSRKRFRPDRENRDRAIRSSVGIVYKEILEGTGERPESIAILATWNRGIAVISRALTGNHPNESIRHTVQIDDAAVLLSSRVVAFLLEPRADNEETDIATALDLVAAVYRSKGGKTSLAQAIRVTTIANDIRNRKAQRKNQITGGLGNIFQKLLADPLTGDPRRDWSHARNKLKESGNSTLIKIAEIAEQLVLLQKGHRIAAGLSDLWQTHGCYLGARVELDNALAEEQLLSGLTSLQGIHVTTIHRSKAKEFDGVVILDDQNSSPLLFTKESAPYPRSRKLLRVGITRAKHHVLMLTDLFKPSILLNGHKL